MKNKSIALLGVVLGMTGLAWMAEARVSSSFKPVQLVYNPQNRVYQYREQTQFANHSLEQKLLTIQFITRHEDQLATKSSP